jgi:hypothetical protein
MFSPVLKPTCPNCQSLEPTVTHESVGTGFYFCRACEHAWYEERRPASRPATANILRAAASAPRDATRQESASSIADVRTEPSPEA